MEWKNNIGVYLETSDGRLTSLSVELLGKARQLADARPNQVLGILAGDNLEAAAQEAIAYGADGVALLQAPALASFDAALYTEAAAFVDKRGRIIRIVTMRRATTDLHACDGPVSCIVEMNAGWFSAHGLYAGDVLEDLREESLARILDRST